MLNKYTFLSNITAIAITIAHCSSYKFDGSFTWHSLSTRKKTLLNKYTFLSHITAISILQIPTRFRYRFDGWFTWHSLRTRKKTSLINRHFCIRQWWPLPVWSCDSWIYNIWWKKLWYSFFLIFSGFVVLSAIWCFYDMSTRMNDN